MILLYLRRFINLISTKRFYFRFPSPLASIRLLKPMHPTDAHSYSFSALPSPPWHWTLNLEPSLFHGPCSWRLPCLCGDLPSTVCHETCHSVWISWWESLRNHWTTMRATVLLIPGTQEGKRWKKTKGFFQAVTHGHTWYCYPGNTAAICLPPAFFCNAVPMCNICFPP